MTIEKGANSQVVNSYVPNGTPGSDSNYYDIDQYNELAKAYRDNYIAELEANQADPNLIAQLKDNPELISVPYATFTRMQFTDSRIEGEDFPVGATSLWFDDAWSYTEAINQYNNDKYNYGFPGLDANPSFIKIHVQGLASTGGPLPGVWATIALAGAASAYLRRRKNK